MLQKKKRKKHILDNYVTAGSCPFQGDAMVLANGGSLVWLVLTRDDKELNAGQIKY